MVHSLSTFLGVATLANYFHIRYHRDILFPVHRQQGIVNYGKCDMHNTVPYTLPIVIMIVSMRRSREAEEMLGF